MKKFSSCSTHPHPLTGTEVFSSSLGAAAADIDDSLLLLFSSAILVNDELDNEVVFSSKMACSVELPQEEVVVVRYAAGNSVVELLESDSSHLLSPAS